VEVLVSFSQKAQINISDFEEFKGGYQGKESQYMHGLVALEKLKVWAEVDGISIILTPEFVLVPSKRETALA
jgi:hypothetical protein